MKIAVISPRKSSVSETFIQAQIDRLKGEIIHYHGGETPLYIGDRALSQEVSVIKKLSNKITRQLGSDTLSLAEYLFSESLKREKPDVILAQYGVLAAKTIKVIKASGIPLIIHFHGYDASVYKVLESLKPAYLEMFSYAKSIIGVSHKMVEMLQEAGAPKEKLHYLCYGPNPRFEKISPKYNSQNFVAVGRFVDKKAPHLTIIAFQKVLEKFPKAQLTFVGDGPLFTICNDIVKHYNLGENIHFLGAKGIDVIEHEMSRACAFVQHSRRGDNGDMEGTPVAILEAQLAGLPVISTRHAGIPDIVRHGETGMIVEENDVEEMAKNMIAVLDNPSLAEKMGTTAKPYILENYSMEKYIAALQAIVDASLEK